MIYNLVAILGVVGYVLAAPTNIDINAILDANAEGGNAGIGDNEEFDATTYLARAGYLDDLDQTKDRHYAPDDVKRGIKEFQTFTGLNVTGHLDGPTVDMMRKPRCGVADVIKPSKRPSSGAPQAYTTKTKWLKKDITYKFGSFTRDLDQASQIRTIREALARWSYVAPVNFQRVPASAAADIVIEFKKGNHGDGYIFDGPGGTLAHAFFPGQSKISGDLHFDDGEEWTLNTYEGQNLLLTAIHEFGHSMGLGHSNVESAIMYPVDNGYKPNPQLDRDDIAAIHSLYGSLAGGTTMTPPPPTMGPAKSNTCDVRFDAIETVHDGTTYAFHGSNIYSIQPQGGRLRHNLIKLMYAGAPDAPDAVAYDNRKRKLFFFRGDQYWRFTGYNLDSGYPKKLARDFEYPSAAMNMGGTLYMFKGEHFARWEEGMRSFGRSYPRLIESTYKGAPESIQAAFVAPSGKVYFFKNTQYWRYERRGRGFAMSPNFPKDTRPFWENCGRLRERDLENLAY